MARGGICWSPLALLLVLCGGCWSAGPGFRTALTSKGLDYIRQVAVPILEKELIGLSIPDISGTAGTPIGEIDYLLKDIKVCEFDMSNSSLTSDTAGLLVQGTDVYVHIQADWQYREHSWPHIEGHGSCDLYLNHGDFQVDLVVGADSKGHATLSCTYCHFYIKDVVIDFHGGASWLYNLFKSYIEDDFKGTIEDEVCSSATQEIDTQGNAALESLPVIIQIDSTAEIDFALIQNPIFTTAYVETQHKGEFYAIAHPVEAPFTPPPLPPVSTNGSRMLYLWLTDYIADTAGFVYETAGIMKYNITPNMVPSSFPFQLNTSSFHALIPQLYDKFPNWGMVLELNATKPPILNISSTGGAFTVLGEVLVYVVSPSNHSNTSNTELAFVLGTTVLADAEFFLYANSSEEIISANATFLKVDLTLVHSNIGTFSVGVLQAAANLLCTAFVIPTINHYANAGLPLPTIDGISLVDPSLTFGQDYVLVGTDFKYTPSLLRRP